MMDKPITERKIPSLPDLLSDHDNRAMKKYLVSCAKLTDIEDLPARAVAFCIKYHVYFGCVKLGNDRYFPGDKEYRDIYKCSLVTASGAYTFRFGQSIAHTETGTPPSVYDVLACLTKYEPGTFDNFISDYGYTIKTPEDRTTVYRTYKAVCREYENVRRLFHCNSYDDLLEIA